MPSHDAKPEAELSPSRGGIYYGWVLLAVCFVIITVVFGIQNSYAVFFKPIQTEFELSRTVVSGAAALSMFLGGGLGMFVGRFADRHGPRLAVLLTGSIFSLGLVLVSIINTPWQLYLVYGLMVSLGFAGGYSPLVATASRWFTARRGLALGIIIAGMGFGTLVLPPVSERLLNAYEWRGAYLSLGIIALILIVGATLLLKRDPKEMGLLPDGKRYPASPLAARNTEPFTRRAIRSPHISGLTLLQSVKTRAFWFIFMMFASVTLCLYVILVHMFQYITDLKPEATTMAALVQGLIGGFSLPGKIAGGISADRFGARRSFVITMVFHSLALLWLTQAKAGWEFYVFAAVFGLSYGGWGPLIPSLAVAYFGLRNIGAITGLLFWGATIGATVGPILAGFIFDTTQSYFIAFLLAAGVAIGAAGLALLLPRRSYLPEHIGEVR